MQILQRGKEYLLSGSDRTGTEKPVHILFCHKDGEGRFINGMTSEEMLSMLIERQQFMLDRDPSAENIQTLLYLKKALDCMTQRNTVKMQKKKNNEDSRHGVSVQVGSAKG